MRQDMPARIRAELTELEPQTASFDARLKTVIASVQSMVALPYEPMHLPSMNESVTSKIHSDVIQALFGKVDLLPACKAAAYSVRAGHTDVEALIKLGCDARKDFVKQLTDGIRKQSLRLFVKRILELEPDERSMGLPRLIGLPDLIVHARLHRGNLIDLQPSAQIDAELRGRTIEVLHSRCVETWIFGLGWINFRDEDPWSIAKSETKLDLLHTWLEGLEPYTLRALAEREAAYGLPLLTGKPEFAVYARCKLACYLLNRDECFAAICRARTVDEVLDLLGYSAEERFAQKRHQRK